MYDAVADRISTKAMSESALNKIYATTLRGHFQPEAPKLGIPEKPILLARNGAVDSAFDDLLAHPASPSRLAASNHTAIRSR
jgi:hypothetical protein